MCELVGIRGFFIQQTTMQINIAKQQMLVDARLKQTLAPELLA